MGYGSSKRQKRSGSYTGKRAVTSRKVVSALVGANPPKRDLSFPQGRQVFRFVATAAASGKTATRANLLNLVVQGITAGSTNQARMFYAVKVMKVRIWGPPASFGAAATAQSCSFEWIGTTSGFRVMNDDNVSNTASYISSPARQSKSDADFWILTGINESVGEFKYTCPVGSIIDLEMMVTIASSEAGSGVTLATSASLAAYTVAYNALDGTSNVMQPVQGLKAIA